MVPFNSRMLCYMVFRAVVYNIVRSLRKEMHMIFAVLISFPPEIIVCEDLSTYSGGKNIPTSFLGYFS